MSFSTGNSLLSTIANDDISAVLDAEKLDRVFDDSCSGSIVLLSGEQEVCMKSKRL